jgi:peroxiredoxin
MPLALLATWAALSAAPPVDFELHDPSGTPVRLSSFAEGRPVAVVFLGVDCPLANLYTPRLKALAEQYPTGQVKFLAVNPLPQDTLPALARFGKQHGLPFPIVKDPDAGVAVALRVTRTPEVVLLDADRQVRYRGRIDNQYEPGGKNRGSPDRADLAEAIRELLAGEPISVAETPAAGCLIPVAPPTRPEPTVTFRRDVVPILQARCQACHRPGEIAPFALTTYDEARHWAPMMAEVTANGTMPPWHANPDHGRFRNDRRLTAEQKRVIARWAEEGCPEGDPADAPPPVKWPDGWAIGTPDLVLRMPAPFRVPAEGILDYQHVIVDTGAAGDLWVRAAEVRPGNRRVLHHCNVFLHPPDAESPTETYMTRGTLGSYALIAFTPGTGPLRLPPGMTKKIPAGWKLHFVLHYTPIGTPTSDQTELGLVLLDPKDVRKEVATKAVINNDIRIPPGMRDYRIERIWRAEVDTLLLSLYPHMHLRGKSFRYVAEYPDRAPEVLLDVPAYDFNWQHRYELVEPKRLPAGTVIRCSAVYDNSPGNPNNPDPTAEVRAGEQSTDEMFNGYFDMTLADPDPVPGPRPFPIVLVLSAAAIAAFYFGRRRWMGRQGAASRTDARG